MKIKDILKELLRYYEAARMVGHTQTMMEGVANHPESLVIVGNLSQSEWIRQRFGSLERSRFVALNGVVSSLRDGRVPIAFDNTGIWRLLTKSLEEIERLENLLKKLEWVPIEGPEQLQNLPSGMFALNGYKDMAQVQDVACRMGGRWHHGDGIKSNVDIARRYGFYCYLGSLDDIHLPGVSGEADISEPQQSEPVLDKVKTEPVIKPAGLQDYAQWEEGRQAIRDGKVRFGIKRCSGRLRCGAPKRHRDTDLWLAVVPPGNRLCALYSAQLR